MRYEDYFENEYRRDIESEKELGRLYLLASKGEISIEQLVEESEKMKETLPESAIADLLIGEGLDYICQLHNGCANNYSMSALKKFAKLLLGEESKDYFFKPEENVQIKITYEKTKD